MNIKSACVDCGNTQTAHRWQCDCGCGQLAKVGDYVSIHSQGEIIFGEILEFIINSCNNRVMVVIDPDNIDDETKFFTEEIEEILL